MTNTQRAASIALTPTGRRAAPSRNFATRWFGYDLFLSFALGPPPRGIHSYASDLARRLRERDFTVFFSEDEAPPGEQLDRTLLRALHRSRLLVVIANRGTLEDPRWVRKEVEEFRRAHPDRPVIPINVAGALQDPMLSSQAQQWLAYQNKIWLDESADAAETGIASSALVERLVTAPTRVRSNVIWRWLVRTVMTILVVLVVALVVLMKRANDSAHQANVALSQASVQIARQLVEIGQPGEALARLAQALRADPESVAARSWTSDLLLNEGFRLPRDVLPHKSFVNAAAFSPDGKLVVTASSDKTAQVWNTVTGERVGKPLEHQSIVTTAEFGSGPRSGLLFTKTEDDIAFVWNLTTGKNITADLADKDYLDFLGSWTKAVTPDGSIRVSVVPNSPCAGVGALIQIKGCTAEVVSSGPDGRAVVKPLRRGFQISKVAISPDGRRVVTGSGDGTAQVWNSASGEAVGDPLQHDSTVSSAAFSPDASRVITGTRNGKARVWDAVTGRPVGVPLQHQATVSSVAFSPDGKLVVTASWDRTARVWDASTGRPVGAPLQHQGIVRTAAFSPDGRRIVTASSDSSARLWDTPSDQPIRRPLVLERPPTAFAFRFDGSLFAASIKSGHVIDGSTGETVGRPLQQQSGDVSAFTLSPDGSRVITIAQDGDLQVWEIGTGRPVGKPIQREGVAAQLSLAGDNVVAAFSPDGSRVVIALVNNDARVWNLATGRPVGNALHHQLRIYAVAFDPSGHFIVTASQDRTARVWDAETGKQVTSPLFHELGGVTGAAFSPDGLRMVTGSFDNTARVWDLTSDPPKQIGATLQHPNAVTAAAFSSDGLRVATGSLDNTARVWDAASGLPVGALVPNPFRGTRRSDYNSSVKTVAFTPDGRRMAILSTDGIISVWPVLLELKSEDTQRLADLAEVLSGSRVGDLGAVEPLTEPERLKRVQNLMGPAATVSVHPQDLLRNFLDAHGAMGLAQAINRPDISEGGTLSGSRGDEASRW